MALAFVRLEASDVALAEAAIGAGITGALLLDALSYVGKGVGADTARAGQDGTHSHALNTEERTRTVGRRGRIWLAILILPLAAGLALGIWTLADVHTLREVVAAALETHPVANPVTVVLIDYRAYDTFLEMGVLALAALGAFLLKAQALDDLPSPPPRASLVLLVLTCGLVPLMVLTAGYLLWAGTALSGGAFPAGAILGAAGVLMFLAGIGRDLIVDQNRTRFMTALGLLSFIVVGGAAMLAGHAFLDWGAGWTYPAIVAIEATLTLGIGGVLVLLYGASAKAPGMGLPNAEEVRQ